MSIQSSDLGSGVIPLTLRAKSCDRIMKHFKQLQEIVSKIHSKDLYDSSYTNDKLLELLFENFYKLGLAAEESNCTLKDMPLSLIQPIVSTVIEHETDILILMCKYEGWMSTDAYYAPKNASSICRFRSGLQYLFENFNGLSEDLDRVLDYIKFIGVDDFDVSLTAWMTFGEETLQAGDVNPKIPKSHYWWFL